MAFEKIENLSVLFDSVFHAELNAAMRSLVSITVRLLRVLKVREMGDFYRIALTFHRRFFLFLAATGQK